MPERIQLSRAKGWRMPENTVKVARPGPWGNPYRVEVFGRGLAVTLYRYSLEGFWSPSLVEHLSDELAHEAYRCHTEIRGRLRNRNVRELAGKRLACWCKLDEACHADVLMDLANAPRW
jgi:hypothetical protein